MKRSLFFAGTLFVAAVAFAAPPLYRIDLKDGSHIFAKDSPVHRGSMLLFHLYPSGVLTGLPEESILAVNSQSSKVVDEVTVTAPRVLVPGEVIYLGPTGGQGSSTQPAVTATASAPAIPGGVYDPRMPGYGGYTRPRGGTVIPGTSGDLARAPSGPPPTAETLVAPNGFPVTGASSPPMGPNGEPILAPAGSPGSTPPVIGPNGTPIMAPAGTPGSTPPATAPNGYPVR